MKLDTGTILMAFTVYAMVQVTNEIKFTGVWILDIIIKGILCLGIAVCVTILVQEAKDWYKNKQK